jgi:hypothetical protein
MNDLLRFSIRAVAVGRRAQRQAGSPERMRQL